MPGHSSLPCADCVNLSAMPGTHVFLSGFKTWIAGTSSAKTRFALLPGHDGENGTFAVTSFSQTPDLSSSHQQDHSSPDIPPLSPSLRRAKQPIKPNPTLH